MPIIHIRSIKARPRRGAIVVFALLCLVIVLAFLVFTVDLGYIVVTESELQNAADAGALSGARGLSDGRVNAVAAALQWTKKNTAAGHGVDLVVEEDVKIGLWDDEHATFQELPATSLKVPNAVRVICKRDADRGNALKLFFAPIFGTTSANLEVSSIAMCKGHSCGGIIALNRIYLREQSYTDSYNSNFGDYFTTSHGANGDVCTNGHVRLIGTAGINGDAHPGPEEDGVDMGGTNYVTGDIEMLEELIDFPAVDVGSAATTNNNDSIPVTAQGKTAIDANGVVNLGGGGQNSKKGTSSSSSADSLTLAPGTYYFSGLQLSGGATIRVTGETYIYVNGDVNLTGGGIVNETRIPMKLQIYPLGSEFWLPNDIDLHAVIYSTSSAIEKDGGAGGFFGKMVGQKIKINGSGGLHVDDSVVFGKLRSGGEQLGTSNGSSLVD